MASSALRKSSCATCGKAAGTFTCRGCALEFCTPHASEHRQALGKQMDEVTLGHDQLQQSLTEHAAEPLYHPLMKKIDEWEQQSINKIHQAADDARKQLVNALNKNMSDVTDTLAELKQQLSKARHDDDFVETDLQEWIEKLEKLKNNLIEPRTINIGHADVLHPFTAKICISEVVSMDTFERSVGNIHVEGNGRVIVHGQTTAHAAARGKCEFSFGQYRVCFRIEQLDARKWAFFGIISKDAPMHENSWNSPTTYGWAGYNQVYINGVHLAGFNGYKSDMEMNDTLELLVDCDRRTIRLKNERTNSSHELHVDTAKCPFPWQLNLNFACSGDRIRILS